jgi:hypothetical protein
MYVMLVRIGISHNVRVTASLLVTSHDLHQLDNCCYIYFIQNLFFFESELVWPGSVAQLPYGMVLIT